MQAIENSVAFYVVM